MLGKEKLTDLRFHETLRAMKLPKELTTVTRLSKIVAMILFIALPIVGFLLGMRHQQIISSPSIITNSPTPTPSTDCYYIDNPEAACPMKDCGKILICPTPVADETANPDLIGANWKTFAGTTKDPVIKHLFLYPPDLVISQVPGLLSNGVTNKTDYMYLNNQKTGEMQMSSDFTPGTFQAFAHILNLDNKDSGENAISKENKTLGGKVAIRIFMNDRYDPKVKIVQYKVYDLNIKGIDKKWGLFFSCYFVPKEGIDLEKQCDKIASTFQFSN